MYKVKTYEIEYRLSNNDICNHKFLGRNKKQAIKNYINKTGCPESAIIYVEDITDLI